MASGPITSWEIDGETVAHYFLGSKITADGDCSHEIKRHLLFGRKVMTNLDSILRSRDITLSTKVHLVKAMVFPAVMYGCESWTIKEAECQRSDAFELWCWRRLLRVPWTARRSNQSILKEISPEYSLEGLMRSWSSSTLATWCEELTPWKRPWCWERLKAGEEGVDRGQVLGWHHWLMEFTQTYVHWVGDAIHPSHTLSSPSPPTFNLSQHQGLFKWVSSSHQVANVLEFQLQHQSFQWTSRTDLL